ncbi:DUF6183 family protein [Streptomyces sp. enrichment culture]|uniref:DUF6183 family protein n=1 Tax=Streptomyces sp. enrichment culture TaxID=1795815 RepID=UPI003F5730FC
MSHDRVTPGDGASERRRWEEAGPEELARLAGQRPGELFAAAEQLCAEASGEEFGGSLAVRTVGRIAEALAETRSQGCAAYAVDIVGRLLPSGTVAWEEGDRIRRSVAARLAKVQPLRNLEPLFGQVPDGLHDSEVETRACLLGELALLGTGTGRARMDAYAERLRTLGHPLAWLPETRLDIEHRFMVRVRGLGSVKTLRQLRARFPEVPPSETGADAGLHAVGVPDDARAQAAARPFVAGGWARAPEARFFVLPAPIEPGDFGTALLQRLPLDCLEGDGTAVACMTTPDDVLNELFSAAYHGGAGGQGQGGAYARLFAWESLYALMGLPADVPHLDAVRRTPDHRWLRFLASTPWFHHDIADLGLAVLDASRTRVAVLAATDTDVMASDASAQP